MWAKHYERCIKCGTLDVRHLARGLCAKCYYQASEARHRGKAMRRGLASTILTKEYLEEEYLGRKRSMSAIAREVGCGRQYVQTKLSEYGIGRRSLHEARQLALGKGNVTYTRRTGAGRSESFVLEKRVVNEDFFSSWSKEMAWVLGLVYTDGYMDPGRQEDPSRRISQTTASLSIGQKEPELLLKVLGLMDSNAQLKTVTGGTLVFAVSSNKIYNDLVNIGLRPRKSLNMCFPDVPDTYLSHFIRGCWDGDGSIGYSKGRYRARFFCGSLAFVESLVKKLVAEGLPSRNIPVRYTRNGQPYYNVSFGGKHLVRLYEVLYRDAEAGCYLERKQELFEEAYKKYRQKMVGMMRA